MLFVTMADERFSVDSAVRGFHIYKDIWNSEIGELLMCEKELGNIHDPYTVSVGHVPRLCVTFFLEEMEQ